MPPETRYARSGEINIGYQVVGRGGHDLVLGLGWVSHLDAFWEEPRFANFVEQLASFARVVLYDKRGTGLSDAFPLDQPQSIASRVEDLAAVIAAAGCQRPVIVECSSAAAFSIAFAAERTDLVSKLIVIGGEAGRSLPSVQWNQSIAPDASMDNSWGVWANADLVFPSAAADPRFAQWWSSYVQRCVRPGMARTLGSFSAGLDFAADLGRITAPTLYLHAAGDRVVSIEHSRFLASRTPGATLIELPGEDHLPFLSGAERVLAEIERMVNGSNFRSPADPSLCAVLATEICDAVEIATSAGHQTWGTLSLQQRSLVRNALDRYGGEEVARPLNGTVAVFEDVSDAVACARAIADETAGIGLQSRAGIHMGEIVRTGGLTSGVSLHLATWVMQQAQVGEILTSGPAYDLMPGSWERFELAGTQVFPSVPGEWRMYRLRPDEAIGPGMGDAGPHEARRPVTALSRREREIAALLALGLTNRQIADELFISVGTVERHVANILIKLGFQSRMHVAAWAVEQGLLRPSVSVEESQ